MNIRVTLVDPNGRSGPAILPDHIPLRRLIPAIVKKLNLPTHTNDDTILIYSLANNNTPLDGNLTLAEANIQNEAILQIEAIETEIEAYERIAEEEIDIAIQILGPTVSTHSQSFTSTYHQRQQTRNQRIRRENRIIRIGIGLILLFTLGGFSLMYSTTPSASDSTARTIQSEATDPLTTEPTQTPLPQPTRPPATHPASSLLNFELTALDWVKDPHEVLAHDGQLYFTAVPSNSKSIELWRTDGTQETAVQVIQFNSSQWNKLTLLASANDQLFFAHSQEGSGTELWATDGTISGTTQLHTFPVTLSLLNLDHFTPLVDKTYFVTTQNDYKKELWQTDGTPAGTSFVKNILPLPQSSPQGLITIDNHLYFMTATDSSRQLWQIDGSEGDPLLVTELTNSIVSSTYLATLNGRLILITLGETTSISQRLVQLDDEVDIDLVEINIPADRLLEVTTTKEALFISTTSEHGRSLWVTTGSTIHQIEDVMNDGDLTLIHSLHGTEERVFFSAKSDLYGSELWQTNGRSEISLIVDVAPNKNSYPAIIGSADGLLYFVANDGRFGHELWVTNGETETAVMVSNIGPSDRGIHIISMTTLDEDVYFVSSGGTYGRLLWHIDWPERTTRVNE